MGSVGMDRTFVPKRVPQFSTVSALRPDSAGWNLVLKVGETFCKG